MKMGLLDEDSYQLTGYLGPRSSMCIRLLQLVSISWLVVVIGRAIPLVASWSSLDLDVWLILTNGFGLLIVAIVFGAASVSDHKSMSNFSIAYKRPVKVLAFASALGALFIAVEFIFLRGYGLDTPVADIRITEVNNSVWEVRGGYGLSGIGRFLTPALAVAWVLALMAWKTLNSSSKWILGCATALVLAQQALFEGGRLSLATLVSVSLITLWWNSIVVPAKDSGKHRFPIFKIGIAVILTLGYFLYVFSNRVGSSGNQYEAAWNAYSSAFGIESNDSYFSDMSGFLGAIKFGIAMLWMYITQGPNELSVLLSVPDREVVYGQTQFFQLAILLYRLGLIDSVFNTFWELPNSGTYTTMLGAAIVDFGMIGGLVFVGAIGFFAGRCARSFECCRVTGAALSAPFLALLVVFSPIVSITNTVWPSIVWCYIASYLLSKKMNESASQAVLSSIERRCS